MRLRDDLSYQADHFTHMSERFAIGHAEGAFRETLGARAQAEHGTAAADEIQIHDVARRLERAAHEGECDARSELELLAGDRRRRQQAEGRAERLRGPDSIDGGRLVALNGRDQLLARHRRELPPYTKGAIQGSLRSRAIIAAQRFFPGAGVPRE